MAAVCKKVWKNGQPLTRFASTRGYKVTYINNKAVVVWSESGVLV